MPDALREPFALPEDYVEQTKSLRDKTALELYDVRAKIADLQKEESRLVLQLDAMDDLVNSVSTTGDLWKKQDKQDSSTAGEQPSAGPKTVAPDPQDHGQPSIVRLLGSSGTVPTGSIDPQSETSERPMPTTVFRSSRNSPDLAKSVDAVVDVLREHGALHYRTIYEMVERIGVSVIGKDPAAVLLSRFSRDPRIVRVGSGTYAVVD